jgi:hypothetical protein
LLDWNIGSIAAAASVGLAGRGARRLPHMLCVTNTGWILLQDSSSWRSRPVSVAATHPAVVAISGTCVRAFGWHRRIGIAAAIGPGGALVSRGRRRRRGRRVVPAPSAAGIARSTRARRGQGGQESDGARANVGLFYEKRGKSRPGITAQPKTGPDPQYGRLLAHNSAPASAAQTTKLSFRRI